MRIIIKAIALMTIGGKSYTGSLVNNNNPGESGKNYFITTSLPFNGNCSNSNTNTYISNISFKWKNGDVTSGATVINTYGEVALLELDESPSYDEIVYLGIDIGGTPEYCHTYSSSNTNNLYKYYRWGTAGFTNVNIKCSEVNEYGSSISTHLIHEWDERDGSIPNTSYSKGAPILDDDNEIVGTFITAIENDGTNACNKDTTYFADLTDLLFYLSPSGNIEGVKIKPCEETIVEDDPINANKTVKAINIIGKSKINNVQVRFLASNKIILDNGFESGNDFIAEIKPCQSEVVALKNNEENNNLVENFEKEVESKNVTLNNNIDINAYPTVI